MSSSTTCSAGKTSNPDTSESETNESETNKSETKKSETKKSEAHFTRPVGGCRKSAVDDQRFNWVGIGQAPAPPQASQFGHKRKPTEHPPGRLHKLTAGGRSATRG